VERAPVPPHERPWRHPSELAAGARAELVAEPATTSAKLLTISLGAFTLIALAAVVVAFTPDRADEGLADRATPSTVASALLSAGRTFVAELTAATEERVAVTTIAASPAGNSDTDADRADGTAPTATATATVPLRVNGARTLVTIEVAPEEPDPHDRVTALTDPPVRTSYLRVRAALAAADAPDDTVVVDGAGRLVGVWSVAAGARRLVPAAELAAERPVSLRVGATSGDRD
jgi:hypothetical protein